MGTINDFKLIDQYCKIYFEKLNIPQSSAKISDSNVKRFGFYLLGMSLITGNNDFDELQCGIIDTDFCKNVYNEKNNDYGIDAYYMDYDENKIYLFNFKFRENFSVKKGGKKSPLLDSLPFVNMMVKKDNFKGVQGKSKKAMEEINEAISSQDPWRITLYIVSNENNGISFDTPELQSLQDAYAIEFQNIIIDDFIGFLSGKPEDIQCKFILDEDALLTYSENSRASSKSYLVRLNLAELLRITCKNEELRNDTNIDYSKIKNVSIDDSILYDNIRGYLGENSKYNVNIMKTLKDAPEKFFMFNNGITIVSKHISAKSINAGKKYSFNLDGIQVVNGGQTLKSIYKFNKENFHEESIAEAQILVRIFDTENNEKLINEIAEYTNSQNSISTADLKSISNLQIKIEKYLEENGIEYIRKRGEIEKEVKTTKTISKERLAQIIYSNNGYPDRAANQKTKLFDKYYDEIFNEDEIEFDKILELIELYYEAEEIYKKHSKNVYPQKILYVIYLKNKGYSITDSIELIEKTVVEYRSDETISNSRKLVQTGYKDFLNSKLSEK